MEKICNRIAALALVMALAVSFAACAVNEGPEQQGSGSYRKLVATSVSTCEVLEKLGVPSEQVVGIPKTTAYTIPNVYEDATVVGSPMGPDM